MLYQFTRNNRAAEFVWAVGIFRLVDLDASAGGLPQGFLNGKAQLNKRQPRETRLPASLKARDLAVVIDREISLGISLAQKWQSFF